MSPKNGPPDRWMDYSPMGKKIARTRFICLKVPLKPGFMRNMRDEEKFSCETAIEMAASRGYKLGLVIDLTFTKKYYDPLLFEEQNVAYEKIFVPGRVIPEKSVIGNFSHVVRRFEEENACNDNLIAVHCTHGLNRTGYMICRYLIDEKDFDPQEAIEAFEEARGHRIEREIYLNDLLGKPPPSVVDSFPKTDRHYTKSFCNQTGFSYGRQTQLGAHDWSAGSYPRGPRIYGNDLHGKPSPFPENGCSRSGKRHTRSFRDSGRFSHQRGAPWDTHRWGTSEYPHHGKVVAKATEAEPHWDAQYCRMPRSGTHWGEAYHQDFDNGRRFEPQIQNGYRLQHDCYQGASNYSGNTDYWRSTPHFQSGWPPHDQRMGYANSRKQYHQRTQNPYQRNSPRNSFQ